MDNLKVSLGREMRKAREDTEQGVPLLLPSGFVVRVKAISLDACIKLGYIPDGLTSVVMAAFMGQDTEAEAITKLGQLKEEIEYWEHLCRHCLVEPRIVDTPSADDEIAIDDLTGADKQYVAQAVLRPVHELRSFCEQQNADLESVFREQAVHNTAQPDHQPEPVGE